MWYSDMYRRHLCDMHIADHDDRFLSEFSPEEYVENLKKANIQNAMLYFQSHVGLCYYPTKIGVMHKAFVGKEDMMKRVEELCHDAGIAVTGYYSLNYNTVEHDRHPNWRMLQENGRSRRDNADRGENVTDLKRAFASAKTGRYGLCCPNNFEYREFVYRQIDEMLAYFKVEGLFFDMPFWSHTCRCPKCIERWAREVGTPFPIAKVPEGTDEYITLITKKYEWMGEWIQAVTDYVKSKDPTLSVEHNFADGIAGNSGSGCGEEVNAACDFCGGDLYGGIINHSLACKFYKNITRNQPFDYMFSRCKPALRSHTLTKTYDEMKTEVMSTAAHHGATLFIDAIDPLGTLDGRVYDRIGDIFKYESEYEPYMAGDMIEDVGLYYSMRSRFGSDYNGFDNKSASIGVSKTLIGAHIPFGVTGSFYSLDKYKALVIPMVARTESHDNKRILNYIANGGVAYLSGGENPELIEALTGGKLIGRTREKNVYIAPKSGYEEIFCGFNEKYPLPFEANAPILEMLDRESVVATLTMPYTRPDATSFASIHSDPPGVATDIPAVVMKKYGKGRIVWSALPIEALSMYEYQTLFLNLFRELLGDYKLSFDSGAPDDVEITAFNTDEYMTVNAIHLLEKAKMPTLPSFEIKMRCTVLPKRVELLPNRENIKFSYENGYVSFKTRELHVFDMYRIIK